MEFFLLYLFVMIENIGSLFWMGWPLMWISLAVMASTAFICALTTEGYGEERSFTEIIGSGVPAKLVKITKRLAILGAVLILIFKLMPDQKQLAIIVGSGVTYNVLTSDPVKQIGNKAFRLLEQKIDSVLKDEKLDPAPATVEPKPEPAKADEKIQGQAT